MTKRLFVVDAMAMAFRNYHAFGARGGLSNSAGTPTSAVFGSLMFLTRLIQDEKPDYLVVATDSREKTFRHEIFSAYKANRSEMPEELAQQLPYLFRLFKALGIPLLKEPGLEADDLIGSLVTRFAGDAVCYIVSGDKDFMQLVNNRTYLYVAQKGAAAKIIDEGGVQEKFGCRPEQVVDILALIGDSSDNVPGVPGVGEKGAAQLIKHFGSLDEIYRRLSEITNKRQQQALAANQELAYLSKTLVTIKTDAPLPVSLDDLRFDDKSPHTSLELLELCRELEFKNMTREIEGHLAGRPVVVPPAPEVQSITSTRKNYQLVDNAAGFAELLQTLTTAEAFACDTETTGLDSVMDEAIGVSFAISPDEAFYLPLFQKHLKDLDLASVKNALAPVLKSSQHLKIGHNLKFDLQMLKNCGIPVCGPYFDTMIASHLLDPNSRNHGLDHCCLVHLNYKKIPTSSLIGKDGAVSMLDVDLEELCRYACEDADLTWQLFAKFKEQLVSDGLDYVFHEIEMPLIDVLAAMEQRGVYLDCSALEGLGARLEQKEQELQEQIYELAGEAFNINSPKQLQVILYEKLQIPEKIGLKRIKKTKSGMSTDVSVLEQLAEHPLPRAILEYRSTTKLKNTYVEALPKLVSPKTSRVHTSYHQTGAATGRLSSSEPNLQNIPIRSEFGKEIRKAFCCPGDDLVLISADYSQIELRILAHLSGDENLMRAFAEGEDIHSSTAAKIFGVSPEEVSAEQRSQAKAINFGIIYGMGPQRLARETGVKMGQAKEFIERYFSCYPGIARYIDEAVAFVQTNEFARTLTGRKRPIPQIREKNAALVKNAQNMAINSPVQGSAADLIKLAMVKLQKRLEESGLHAKILLQVHDELVLECPAAEAAEVSALIKETMETALPIKVPLQVDVGAGRNWLEAH